MAVSEGNRQKRGRGKEEGLKSMTNPTFHYKICVLMLTKRHFYKPKI